MIAPEPLTGRAMLVLTFLAAFLPTYQALRREITQERQIVRRVEAAPFWKRAYLDLILPGAAAVVLAITVATGGFKPSGTEGAGVGILLARLLVFVLAVIFTIPAKQFAWPGLELLALAGLVVAGMLISTVLSARRLATLKVVEALREL